MRAPAEQLFSFFSTRSSLSSCKAGESYGQKKSLFFKLFLFQFAPANSIVFVAREQRENFSGGDGGIPSPEDFFSITSVVRMTCVRSVSTGRAVELIWIETKRVRKINSSKQPLVRMETIVLDFSPRSDQSGGF